MLKDMNIEEFIKDLSSEAPAPGGGGAAAMTAALSSALSSMVFNLTVGKKCYNAYDEHTKQEVDKALESSLESTDEFLNYMDKDAKAFLELMSLFKLPKTTDQEKADRQDKLQEGYRNALGTPLELARKCLDSYSIIDKACKLGNKNVISDAGVAALLLQAAIESAILNVYVNLAYIKDESYKEQVREECVRIKNQGNEIKNSIMKIVYENI
ncbi:MAG: cyclodeaminase/cyclohydrolase family protein [Bacillota bacterium]|nr:cyclodeaminase/cyclohydrolase family protein [Bacillota bacterium]